MSRGCCATSGSAAKISSSTPYVLPNGESGSECEVDLLKLEQPDVLTVLPTHRFAAAFALRQRMLNFVQNIQYYMMFEVMEPTWHIMENNLKTVSGSPAQFQSFSEPIFTDGGLVFLCLLRRLSPLSSQASNIDDVLCHHTSFLDNCLKDCMLTNPELLRIFSKLMAVCVMFTNCMQVC